MGVAMFNAVASASPHFETLREGIGQGIHTLAPLKASSNASRIWTNRLLCILYVHYIYIFVL